MRKCGSFGLGVSERPRSQVRGLISSVLCPRNAYDEERRAAPRSRPRSNNEARQEVSQLAIRLGAYRPGMAANTTLESSLRNEYARLLARVTQQLEQADRLRALADQLEDSTARDEHLLEELAAALGMSAQLRIEELSLRLRGQRLREVALDVLQTYWSPNREIHYREWFDLVQEHAGRVGGKDPLATFLAQVHRAPGVEKVGRRTGRYRLIAA